MIEQISLANFIKPTWPAPSHIHAYATTRQLGVSTENYAALNLADHVGDNADLVLHNRRLLRELLPNEPCWLKQVHGNTVIQTQQWQPNIAADASVTTQKNQVCVVMTADCLPILVCNRDGTTAAAIHAGWRSLAKGIIKNTIQAMQTPTDELLVWFGPHICSDCYEIGPEVYEQFINIDSQHQQAFKPSHRADHYLANLSLLAKQQCQQLGITAFYESEHCTKQQADLFYSYRRNGETGRFASMIWFD